MGEFAKWAEQEEQLDQMEKTPRPKVKNWRERAAEQVGRLKQRMPLAAEEGAQNASELLKQLSSMLYGLGYQFRMKRHQENPDEAINLLPRGDPGIPGRDISISLPESEDRPAPELESDTMNLFPKTAAWLEPRLFSKEAVGPIRAWLQNAKVESGADLKERRHRAFAPTENPLTVPGFVPIAAITAPESFRKGFVQADTDASSVRNQVLSEELEQAKQEFEQALSEEYKGRKAASAGEWLDNFTHKLFDLEKVAESDQGNAMKMLNAYLGAAALLGYGTHRATEKFVSSRDPSRQKHKLYRMALRQRMHDKGVPVLVDFNELPASKAEENLTDELPVQEAKEAGAAARNGGLLALVRSVMKSAPAASPAKLPGPILASVGNSFPMSKEMRKFLRKKKLQKRAKIRLLGAEGLDSGQVDDFNTAFKTKSTWTPPASWTSPASTPSASAARNAAVDASQGTVQNPMVRGNSGSNVPVNIDRPYNPAIHGKDDMAQYKLPEGYTPPAGSYVDRAWKGIAQNRKYLGELPGGAAYDQSAREHAYEGEQVYQKQRRWNEKTYADMAAKGWISPTNNADVYDGWRKRQRDAQGRAELIARAERARKGIQEKGLQGQWEDYQSRGGWKQEYPKGTNFAIDVDDPRTQTPEMRRNIAMGKINKQRNQSAGALLNKVQSGQFNPGTGRAQQYQTGRANALTSLGRGGPTRGSGFRR